MLVAFRVGGGMSDDSPSQRDGMRARRLAVAAGALVPLAFVEVFLLGWTSVTLVLVPAAIIATSALAGRAAWLNHADLPRARRRAVALRSAASVGGGLVLGCVLPVVLALAPISYADFE